MREISGKGKNIPKNLNKIYLSAYVNLKKTRGLCISGKLLNNRCSGCNMLLPTIVIDRLKNMGEIVYV